MGYQIIVSMYHFSRRETMVAERASPANSDVNSGPEFRNSAEFALIPASFGWKAGFRSVGTPSGTSFEVQTYIGIRRRAPLH